MVTYYKDFSVDGSANDTKWDTGITSTETEKKKIISVLISVSDYKNNIVRCIKEREDIVKIRDYVLDTYGTSGSTNVQYSTTKMIEIPIDLELPVGQTFQVGIQSGANATNIRGAYKYVIV